MSMLFIHWRCSDGIWCSKYEFKSTKNRKKGYLSFIFFFLCSLANTSQTIFGLYLRIINNWVSLGIKGDCNIHSYYIVQTGWYLQQDWWDKEGHWFPVVLKCIKLLYWYFSLIGRKKVYNPSVQTGRVKLFQTICVVRVEIHRSPTCLAKGPELLSFRVSFFKYSTSNCWETQIYRRHQKSLGKAQSPLKLTLSWYRQRQEYKTHTALLSSVPKSVLTRGSSPGHLLPTQVLGEAGLPQQWFPTAGNQTDFREAAEQQPFLM